MGRAPRRPRRDHGRRRRRAPPDPGADPASCTPQQGAPGAWSERLPHFRLQFTPSRGEEIQAEFFVDRAHAGRAIAAVRAALAPFAATPHWGKLFLTPPAPAHRTAFCRLANTLDPRRAFRNAWLSVNVGL